MVCHLGLKAPRHGGGFQVRPPFPAFRCRFARIQPLLPNKVRRRAAGDDDRRVISGRIHVIRSGLMRRDATARNGPHKTLCNCFVQLERCSGVFNRIFQALPVLRDADTLIGNKGHDSDRVHSALRRRRIKPCIPGRTNRRKPVEHDVERCKLLRPCPDAAPRGRKSRF